MLLFNFIYFNHQKIIKFGSKISLSLLFFLGTSLNAKLEDNLIKRILMQIKLVSKEILKLKNPRFHE